MIRSNELPDPSEPTYLEGLKLACYLAENLGMFEPVLVLADDPSFASIKRAGARLLESVALAKGVRTKSRRIEVGIKVYIAYEQFRAAERWFGGTMMRGIVRESMEDPSGRRAKENLAELFGIAPVTDEHVNALWHVTEREPRDGGDSRRWEQVADSKPFSRFPAWLNAEVRGEARRTALADAPEESEGGAAPADLERPDEAMMMLEMIAAAGLGDREEQVLALHLAGKAPEEIATELGMTRGSVDTAFSRARKKIRAAM